MMSAANSASPQQWRSRLATNAVPQAPHDLREELGKHDEFESAEQETFLNVIRTAADLTADFDRLFAEAELSNPLYNVLRIVAGHGKEGVPSQAIARDLVSRGPDVTRLVDRLSRRGLVERVPCPQDRRVVYVRLLPAGRKLLDSLAPKVRDLHRAQLGHLSETKLRQLSKLLFEARHPKGERRNTPKP